MAERRGHVKSRLCSSYGTSEFVSPLIGNSEEVRAGRGLEEDVSEEAALLR